MTVFIKKFLFPILIFISVFLLILYYINNNQNVSTSVNYTLKAYKNTVALYSGEEVIEVYNNIVLNTLPQKDIQSFKSGISVTTPQHAENYLEDFDN